MNFVIINALIRCGPEAVKAPFELNPYIRDMKIKWKSLEVNQVFGLAPSKEKNKRKDESDEISTPKARLGHTQ